MSVRRVAPYEVNDLLTSGLAATLDHLAPVGESNIRLLGDLVRRILANPNYYLFVAEIDGQVVGTLMLFLERKIIHLGGLVGHIEDVATKAGWEGHGVGTALVRSAVGEARRHSCYKVILDCSEKNVPFYQRLGFRRHEVAMRLDLTP